LLADTCLDPYVVVVNIRHGVAANLSRICFLSRS
jgi:hypothetical protein